MFDNFNNQMLNFFKGEKEFYEFTLIHTNGKVRADLLNVNDACFKFKKAAKDWYNSIINKIEDPKAIEKLNILYDDMIR